MCLGYYVEKWVKKLLKNSSKATAIAKVARYTTQAAASAIVSAVVLGASTSSIGILASAFAAALSSPIGSSILNTAISL